MLSFHFRRRSQLCRSLALTGQFATAVCVVQQSEQLVGRRLLSADISLESVLAVTGTAFFKAEYKLRDGQHSLKFNLHNATGGGYDSCVSSTLLGRITVPATGQAEFKFSTQAKDGDEARFSGGLSLPLVSGQAIRLTPAASDLSP